MNLYQTSKTGEERNAVIKKEPANLARLVLVFKVMINTIYITCTFKICQRLSRDFALEFNLA